MKITLFVSSMLTLTSVAEETATAHWKTETPLAKQGEAIRTVIVMKVSEGWHTYWENPGEGGMPPEIEAALPEGWKIGRIQYPVPKRFTTGDLPAFGYEGEIFFPLTLTPPPGFQGPIPQITPTLSWLACNDEACVPGKANVALTAADEPKAVSKAYEALPQAIRGAMLTLAAEGENILITLSAPQDFDPSALEVFPATGNVIDPSAKPRFAKAAGGTWTASAPKSEYLDGEPGDLSLVLTAPGKGAWKISTSD